MPEHRADEYITQRTYRDHHMHILAPLSYFSSKQQLQLAIVKIRESGERNDESYKHIHLRFISDNKKKSVTNLFNQQS